MSSHDLFDSFLNPASKPSESHTCAADVVACRASADGLIVQEIYRRPNSFLGFRYLAWVASRDAGNTPRSHAWREVSADEALLTDDNETARQVAEHHAISKRLNLLPWGKPQ